MKTTIKVCTCILIGFLCIVSSQLSADNVIPKYPIFNIDHSNVGEGDFVENAVFMTLNKEVLRAVRQKQLEQLDVVIPFENGQRLTLALKKESFLADDFKIQVQSQSGITTLPYNSPLFYGGNVKGATNTLVALNFFEDEISGVFSLNGDNYNIGRYERGGEDSFVLYKEKNLDIPNPFECSTEDPESIQIKKAGSSRSSNNNKVRLYVECDHFMYQNMDNSSRRVADFTAGLLNIVATIYRNESIELEISEIKIWSSPDPYPTTTAKIARNAFGDRLNGNFNGDIAHLISNYKKNGTPPNGGSANIDVLCNKPKAVSYTNITNSYLDFPTFSWTAYAITHEVGHNLGSAHTHSCLWPTGPIDNCWCPEGNCDQGPEPRGSGTLMSYCHLDPNWTNECELSSTNPGIDFAAGFGPQPGDLIRSRINGSTCLTQSTGTTDNPSDPTDTGNAGETPDFTAEVNVSDETCQGKKDGIITLTLKNGQAPYSFKWSNGGNSARVYNVGAGTYSVTVTDANGLTASGSVEVEPGVILEVNAGFDQTINCQNQSVVLDGRRSISGSEYVNIWSKIGGVINGDATGTTLAVSEPGTYVYMVQNQNTGCYATDTVVVKGNIEASSLDLTAGTITCASPTIQLSATTNATNPTYAWTGPGVFSSSARNPQVSKEGVYTLQLTNANGCITTKSITVEAQTDLPSASALGGVLDCQISSVQLTASSNQIVTYEWSGPNGFSSNQQNPTTSIAGLYTLVVTSANGCSNTSTAQVGESKATPSFTLEGGTLTCTQNSVQLSVLTTATIKSYKWTGPSGFSSVEKNQNVSTAGVYTLEVIADNGCKSSQTIRVEKTVSIADIQIEGGELTCDKNSLQLKVNSTEELRTFKWTGPNGFSATEKNPTVSAAGDYTLDATTIDGCAATKTITIGGDKTAPSVSITGGTITCNNSSITLGVVTSDSALDYKWTGPNGFTSTSKNPSVSTQGQYTLEVTNSNGCKASASTRVENTIRTVDIQIEGGDLTCDKNNLQLKVTSTKELSTFKWTGPSGFSATEQNPTISASGNYTLEATTADGCSALQTITIRENKATPSVSITGGAITCNNSSITLGVIISDNDLDYNWTGPNGFTSTSKNPSVSTQGQYTLEVTNSNGCKASASTRVEKTVSTADIQIEGGDLTCDKSSLQLKVTSTEGLSTFKWTGPNGFSTTDQNPTVSANGNYTLEATTADGCIATQTITVGENKSAPSVSITGGTITCNNSSITLGVVTSDSDLDYKWTGPNGFTSTSKNPSVSTQGQYTLEVTNSNGCKASASTAVDGNTDLSAIAVTGGVISCLQEEVQLKVATSVANLTYKWTGPNGFSTSQKEPTVLASGIYSLNITDPSGCSTTKSVVVEEGTATPNINIQGGIITCRQSSVNLKITTEDQTATYSWKGPNGFTSTEKEVEVAQPGAYYIIVTNQNGCTSTVSHRVLEFKEKPTFEIIAEQSTCAAQTTLSVNNPDVIENYLWRGPNNFSSEEPNPVVRAAGAYTLEASGFNGCPTTKAISVTLPSQGSTLSIIGDNLSCTKPYTTLEANASQAIKEYSWTGPNGFASNLAQPTINEPGTYTLDATTEGGCNINKAVVISASIDTPTITLSADPLNCATGNTTLRANSDSFISAYTWTGPNGFRSEEAAPKVSDAGMYTLVAYGGNGCTVTNNITVSSVSSNTTVELYALDVTCEKSGQLIAHIIGSYKNLEWTGPNNFTSTEQDPIVTVGGIYQLEIFGEHGCSIKNSIEVKTNSIEIDNILTQQDDCGAEEGSISISFKDAKENYKILWSTGQTDFSITNLAAGTYSATIENSEGCTVIVTETIQSHTTIAINNLEVQEISCDGQADGQIKVDVIGGVAPYQLLWSNGVTGPVNSDLDRGLHSLEVVDATNCVKTFYFTLSNPKMEVSSAVMDDKVEIVVSGGQPAYSFDWSNGRTSSFETNLDHGNYTVTITDDNGCQIVEHIDIQAADPLDAPLLLSPNPADTYFNLSYELEEEQYVFISIFNSQGHYLYRMTKFTDTIYETIPTAGWENGTYYVQILLKSKKVTEELKVVHN